MSKKFLIIFLSLLSINIFSQTSLEYYLEKGFTNSPKISELKNNSAFNNLDYQQKIAEADAIHSDITANYLFAPYFTSNGIVVTQNPSNKAVGYDVGISNGGLYSAQLNFTKNIFNGNLIDDLSRRTKLNNELNNYQLELEKKNLHKTITQQYLSTYKFQKEYQLSKEILENLNKQMEVMKSQVSKGYLSAENYLLLQVEKENQLNSIRENQTKFINSLKDLKSICGIKDTTTYQLESVNLEVSKDHRFNFLEKYSLDSLSNVNDQKLFESKYSPQVDVFFNTGLNAVDVNNIQRKFGISAGINFRLPLFDGGQNDLEIQKKDILIKNIEAYKKSSALNINSEREKSFKRIEQFDQRLQSINKQINDYKKIIDISASRLTNGDLSMIEYITILKNYIELRKSKIGTEIDRLIEINNFNYWNN